MRKWLLKKRTIYQHRFNKLSKQPQILKKSSTVAELCKKQIF